MKYFIPLFAAGALALAPSKVERDAAGAAIASAALTSVINANQALATAVTQFTPDNQDPTANAIGDLYTAITDGTNNINGINQLSDAEALGLANFVPQLTDSTKQAVDNTIAAKSQIVAACLGTFSYQVFTELGPLAQSFADALQAKVGTTFKPIVASTGEQIQADIARGAAAFADQSPPPCQCGGDCGTSTTTTSDSTTTTSESTTTTSDTTTATSDTTTTSETTTTSGSVSETTTTTSGSVSETTTATTTEGTAWGGWEVISETTTGGAYPTTTKGSEGEYTTSKGSEGEYTTTECPEDEYTTTKGSEGEYTTSKGSEGEYTTTKKGSEGGYTTTKSSEGAHTTSKGSEGEYTTSKGPAGGSSWEAITTKAPVASYTTKAPAGGSSWEAITTKAPGGGEYTSKTPIGSGYTSKAPVASYTTSKAPIATYAGAAAGGVVMNAGAILLAAGAALL